MSLTPILILAALLLPSLVVLGVFLTPQRLTPLQQVFADAEARILKFGLCRGNFTPLGYPGLGHNVPHDLTSSVAVVDPDYDPTQSMYNLASTKHLRDVAYTKFGMAPEDINDNLELDEVLELLLEARRTPPAIEG